VEKILSKTNLIAVVKIIMINKKIV